MKISVSPMPKGDCIGSYIETEKLAKAYEECERKHGKKVAYSKSSSPVMSNRELRSHVIRSFDEIGYEFFRSEGDIRFQSSIRGGMKDLVFKDWNEAKDWLVKAECWK